MTCLHEMIFEGLCAICGQTVDTGSKDHINMTHNTTGITVSLVEAERLEKQDRERLLKEKKLSLIVDLDQTVLHATWEPNIANWVDEQRTKEHRDQVKDLRTFSLDGSMNKYTIKLRPGLDAFLKTMSKYYEMHVYTMGTRSYATAVAKEIDPDGSLFQDRILTRDENKDKSTTKKYLERLFPSDQSKVVILDDRADVWDHSPHLIQVKPYEFFYGIGDINAPTNSPVIIAPSDDTVNKPPSPKEPVSQVLDRPNYIPNPNDDDAILTVIQEILINIHTHYYQQYEQDNQAKPNAATILSQLKSTILRDCHIVFSGVIPLQTKPQDSSIWRMATSFGAKCFEDLTGKATHLIAASPGTNKFNTAIRYQHIHIVYPTWLTSSIWHWKRQDETQFLIPHTKREGSNTSEVENPEEASLDFDDGLGFNWEDDEVDAILMASEEEEDNDHSSEDEIEDWLGAELSESDKLDSHSDHEEEEEDNDDDDDDDEDTRSQKRIKRVY
ncbi:HAD-like domain-containing protein [Blakeslea trispora]|nr:HAD-like domain-containing protein [Blakeslea trispora]